MRKENFEIFEDLELGMLRAVKHEDGSPWFVLADVCKILELPGKDAPKDSAKRLEESEKDRDTIPTPGGAQKMITVSEGGLYYLICTSRKPKAKKFRLWITDTVLVSIRKNNGYLMGQEDLPEKERTVLEEKIREAAPVKSNPMCFDKAYVARDGMVFTTWKDCVEYNKSLNDNYWK